MGSITDPGGGGGGGEQSHQASVVKVDVWSKGTVSIGCMAERATSWLLLLFERGIQ